MLQRGDLVPHFTVNALHGEEFSYETIWQRRNLVTLARLAEVREAAPAYGFNSITERPRQVTA